jgi:hypothetical protein
MPTEVVGQEPGGRGNPAGGRGEPAGHSAASLRSVQFSQATHSSGGLSEDEVRAYIAAVADTMAAAEATRDALRAEVARLRAFYREQGTDVDRPEPRREPARNDATARFRRHVADLVAAAQRYAATVAVSPGLAADQILADGTRRAVEHTQDLLFPQPPLAPPTRGEAERMLRWLDAFTVAMQVQAREAYDLLTEAQNQRTAQG